MNGRTKMLLAQEAARRRGNDYGNPRDNERPGNNYNNGEMRDRPYYGGYAERPVNVYVEPSRYDGNGMNYGENNAYGQYPPPMYRENDYARERRMGFDGGYSSEMHGGSRRNETNSRNTYFTGSSYRSNAEGVTKEKAHEWVKEMKNSDGSKGEHWNMEQIKNLREKMGLSQIDPMEFYVAVNMMYSDYCAVAKKYNVDTPEFYGHLAKAFIEDKDAGPGKIAKYFEIVVDDD